MREVLAVGGDRRCPTPIERMPYDEAMLRYGTDRPDRRIPIEIADLGDGLRDVRVQGLRRRAGVGRRRARLQRAAGELPRRRFDELTERAQRMGAKGLVWGVARGGRLALAGREVPLRGGDRRR